MLNRDTTYLRWGLTAFVLFAVLGGAVAVAYHGSQETVTITVLDKERVCSTSSEGSSCEYRVYAEGETFKNGDSLLFTKFDSADIQGRLQEGDSYDVTVVGWRIPFFSMFRNIIEVSDA